MLICEIQDGGCHDCLSRCWVSPVNALRVLIQCPAESWDLRSIISLHLLLAFVHPTRDTSVLGSWRLLLFPLTIVALLGFPLTRPGSLSQSFASVRPFTVVSPEAPLPEHCKADCLKVLSLPSCPTERWTLQIVTTTFSRLPESTLLSLADLGVGDTMLPCLK